jgi:DNA-binding CsgD family transcriptional regulator
LLQLYARSVDADAETYATFALDGACELLGADKAWWSIMSLSETGPELLSAFGSAMPSTFPTAWKAMKQDDTITRGIAQARNQLVISVYETVPTRGLRRLGEDFDLGEVASLAMDLHDQNAFMAVHMYHNFGRRRFTPEDQSINRLLIPHIRAAWRQNLLERLRISGEPEGGEIFKAFVDSEGKLVQHDERFAKVVARHWRTWRGFRLPLLLREAIERSRATPGSWIGRDAWSVRTAPAGLVTLVELREVTAFDRLAPREIQVAKLFADGATHKEIARLTSLAPTTVRHYLREVYSKLHIDNKASLAKFIGLREVHVTRLIP